MYKRLSRFVWVILVIGAMLQAPAPAWACTCGSVTIQEAVRNSDAVFTGTVRAVVEGSSLEFLRQVWPNLYASMFRQKFAMVEVHQSWKGVAMAYSLVMTPISGGSCGYGFNIGDEYLVYASQASEGLHTSLCTRTQPVTSATADLNYLQTLPTLLLIPGAVWWSLCFVFAIAAISLLIVAVQAARRKLAGRKTPG